MREKQRSLCDPKERGSFRNVLSMNWVESLNSRHGCNKEVSRVGRKLRERVTIWPWRKNEMNTSSRGNNFLLKKTLTESTHLDAFFSFPFSPFQQKIKWWKNIAEDLPRKLSFGWEMTRPRAMIRNIRNWNWNRIVTVVVFKIQLLAAIEE